MDEQHTEWIDARQAPAFVGWYEVQQPDGSVSRYWRGPIWWALMDPSCGIDTNLVGAPGIRWRGLKAPAAGTQYQATASARAHGIAYRILRTGR